MAVRGYARIFEAPLIGGTDTHQDAARRERNPRGGYDFVEDTLVFRRHSFECVGSHVLPGAAANAFPQDAVFCSQADRPREAVEIPALEEETVLPVANDFPGRGDVGGDQRATAGHGFEVDARQAFPLGGLHDHVGEVQKSGHTVVRNPTDEPETILDSEFPARLLHLGEQRPLANDNVYQFGGSPDLASDGNEVEGSLQRLDLRRVDDDDLSLMDSEQRGVLGLRAEAIKIDVVLDRAELSQAAIAQGVLEEARDRDDAVGSAKCLKPGPRVLFGKRPLCDHGCRATPEQ